MKRLSYFFFAVGILFFFSNSTIEAQVATGCYALKNNRTNEYLTHNGGGVDYYANRPVADGWEKFYITKLSDGRYTIYGEDGNFASGRPEWGGVVWKAGQAQDWEKWHINGGELKSHHGTVMAVDMSMNVKRVYAANKNNETDVGPGLHSADFHWTIEPSSGCKVPPAH